MAVTKIWAIHSRLDRLVNYVSNTEKTMNLVFDDLNGVIEYAGEEFKTEQRFFVSGINCQPETAYAAMKNSLQINDKKIKVLGYHAYQSFTEGEVTAHIAHEIGVKLASELWGDKFQVVVATHLNTNHYHNHFVLCSSSFIDGKRFHACKESYKRMREVSDRLCREYRLSVIENPRNGRAKQYAEWQDERGGKPTYRNEIKNDIDTAIKRSMTERQFFDNLRKSGYEIKFGNDITVKAIGKERGLKLRRNFGEEYSIEGIRKRILAQNRPKLPPPLPAPRIKKYKLMGDLKTAKKLTGLRALYFYYLYKMGILPKKKRQSGKRINFLFREDLRKLDKITKEVTLLCKYRINDIERLYLFKRGLTEEIAALADERKHLRYRCRNVKSENEIDEVKAKISDISKMLGEKRKEAGLCDDIAARSLEMKEKIRRVKETEKTETAQIQGKERTDEPFRRRG